MDKAAKTAWQDTIAQLRSWNRAEEKFQCQQAGKKSHQQKWQEGMAIMEFGFKLKPRPSRHEQQEKIEMLEAYYRRMHRFEQRRS